MRKASTIMCLVLVIMSPVVRVAYAGEIRPVTLSDDEARDLAITEAASADQLVDVAAGDSCDEAAAVAVVVLLIILLAAAASSASTAA